jgi:hypothetical protein
MTTVHQENSPQLSNAKIFKSEMQVKDFKRTNKNVTKSKQINAHKNCQKHFKKKVHKIGTRNLI